MNLTTLLQCQRFKWIGKPSFFLLNEVVSFFSYFSSGLASHHFLIFFYFLSSLLFRLLAILGSCSFFDFSISQALSLAHLFFLPRHQDSSGLASRLIHTIGILTIGSSLMSKGSMLVSQTFQSISVTLTYFHSSRLTSQFELKYLVAKWNSFL